MTGVRVQGLVHRLMRGALALALTGIGVGVGVGVGAGGGAAAADMAAQATSPAAPCRSAPGAPLGQADLVAELRQRYAQARACWPAPQLSAGVAHRELAPLPAAELDLAPDQQARLALGQRLFFDPRLSRDGSVACASCHDPAHGWSDGRKTSVGIEGRIGRRNAPSVATSAGVLHAFWDGRAATLEAQALGPVQAVLEMDMPLHALRLRLSAQGDYQQAFRAAYAQEGPEGDAVTIERIGDALARFERSLRPTATRFDAFLTGEVQALSDAELRGLHLFRTRARCLNCHSGPWMSDNGFHNLGLHLFGRKGEDLGRFDASGDARDSGQFKTPSLRGVAATAPYMHHGLIPTLKEVLGMYNVGMPKGTAPRGKEADPRAPARSPLIERLNLAPSDLDDLEAFLNAL